MSTQLNFSTNTLELKNGSHVSLVKLSTGHIGIDISSTDNMRPNVLFTKKELDKSEMMKLHRQFGHCGVDRLCRLITNAGGVAKRNDIQEIVNNCEICVKFGRPKPKPAVSMPLASEFNEVVAMDLHQLKPSVYYIHFIDLFSRYSRAAIIYDKSPRTIIASFISEWICDFGVPQSTLTDNGGEFDNQHFRSMTENYGIHIKTTAAESPWSNGVCERHNAVLTDIFLKLKADQTWDIPDSSLMKYCSIAKNCLSNKDGFSPQQIVRGYAPRLPSTLDQDLPALENVTTSDVIRSHLITLHKTREAYIQSENADRIRRALRANIRCNEENFDSGDSVFYKRENANEWKGPGKVIVDGTNILMKHGGYVVKVHRTRLRGVKTASAAPVPAKSARIAQGDTGIDAVGDSMQHESDQEDLGETKLLEIVGSSDGEPVREHSVPTDCSGQEISEDRITEEQTSKINDNESEPLQESRIGKIPGTKSNVTFKTVYEYGHGNDFKGFVLSRAGKANSKHKNWLNIEYTHPESMAGKTGPVDFENDVSEWSYDEAENTKLALITMDDDFHEAKSAEYQSWIENDVFERVPDEGQPRVTTRWILTVKDDGSRKARLVARGLLENEAELTKDSPTIFEETFRTMMVILAAQPRWQTEILDVKTAFLQGESLSRTVYLAPPQEWDDT